MSFLPGIGGIGGIVGIVEAPFTGGTSLISTAAAVSASKLAIDAKHKAKTVQAKTAPEIATGQATAKSKLITWVAVGGGILVVGFLVWKYGKGKIK